MLFSLGQPFSFDFMISRIRVLHQSKYERWVDPLDVKNQEKPSIPGIWFVFNGPCCHLTCSLLREYTFCSFFCRNKTWFNLLMSFGWHALLSPACFGMLCRWCRDTFLREVSLTSDWNMTLWVFYWNTNLIWWQYCTSKIVCWLPSRLNLSKRLFL